MDKMSLAKRNEVMVNITKPHSYNTHLRGLLDCLSSQELAMLANHPDLISEALKIAKCSVSDLKEELPTRLSSKVRVKSEDRVDDLEAEDFGYSRQAWNFDEYFIDTAHNAGALPSWAKARNFNVGVWESTEYKFKEAGRKLLLRIIRLNLWIRYAQSRIDETSKKVKEVTIQNLQIQDFSGL